MKLITWNVNGIRAASRAGFLDWVEREKAEVVAIQEIKAFPSQLEPELRNPRNYHSYWHPAEKAGYSGVAIFSKKEPLEVQTGLGIPEFDREGRVLQAEFKDFTLINAYFPNSQRDHARLPYKLAFCDAMLKRLEKLRKSGKNVILCGDINIAHQEIDLANPKTNQDNAGFLPEERAWLSKLLGKGYVDAFREFEKGAGHYTWWSYRPGVRERNIGWRLDQNFVNVEFRDRLRGSRHHCETKGSDHCPVSLELKD